MRFKITIHCCIPKPGLGYLPYQLGQVAIPLFTDDKEDVDYQLHPHYSTLQVAGKLAKNPHTDLVRLSVDDSLAEGPSLVIGIARLFVNMSDNRGGRISKWTGYEVFVDKRLTLWMIFDEPLEPKAANFSPPSCRLVAMHSEHHPQRLNLVCFLPSLRSLAFADFGLADSCVRAALQSNSVDVYGSVKVCQAERSEVSDQLYAEFLTAVKSWTAQKPLRILHWFRDNPDTIQNLISEEIVRSAAENIDCGHQLVTQLLYLSEDKVRKSITSDVIKSAVGNQKFGDGILTEFLSRCKDEVCRNVSTDVLRVAAENIFLGPSIMTKVLQNCERTVFKNISGTVIRATARNKFGGGQILSMLHKANPKLVDSLISHPFGFGSPRNDAIWSASDFQQLRDRLKEIKHPLGSLAAPRVSAEEQYTTAMRPHLDPNNPSRTSTSKG